MKRNLKALGLALVAVFAMSAVVVAGAQATKPANFRQTQDLYPVTLKGSQEPETGGLGLNYFESTLSRRFECDTADYSATLIKTTNELTVTPHYATCETGGIGATVALNGCDFTFKAVTTITATESTGTASVHCPKGNSITITAGTCVIHITGETDGWNQDMTGVTFTNKGGNTVTVDVNIKDQIKSHETDGFLCPFEGNTTPIDGDFVSSVTIGCFKDAGNSPHATTAGVTTYTAGAATDCEVE